MNNEQKFVDSLLPDEKYIYCIHCEKPALRSEWVKKCSCPYICDGTPLDGWSWTMISGYNKYPTDPVLNTKYDMYLKKSDGE